MYVSSAPSPWMSPVSQLDFTTICSYLCFVVVRFEFYCLHGWFSVIVILNCVSFVLFGCLIPVELQRVTLDYCILPLVCPSVSRHLIAAGLALASPVLTLSPGFRD